MPFQSEKQRRYMHANLPDIANRWEAKYGLGGIAELNSQLNDLPEYYIPKNQGGRIGFNQGTELNAKQLWEKMMLENYTPTEEEKKLIQWYLSTFMNQGGMVPSHQAGIYGLNEGGNIRLQPHTASDLLVQKTLSGERPKYQPPGHRDAPVGGPPGGGATSQGSGRDYSPPPSNRQPGIETSNTRTTKTTPTADPDGRSQALINISKQKKKDIYGDADLEEQLVIDKRNALNRLKHDPNLTKNERENLEVGLGLRAPKKAFSFGSFIKNAALAIIPGLLPAKLATAWKVGSGVYNYQKGNYDKYLPTDFKSDGKFATHITNTVKENAEKMKTHQKKMDLYESLPDGHPEKIALSVELEIGKKTTPDGPNGEGGVKHPPTETAIKFEDIEEYNKKKMELASTEQIQIQKDVDRSKQMAYWRLMMEPYMSAQGGRVPSGYNTGGLSNLFRLKNV